MEMAQGFKEISMSMTESLKNFSQSLVPILRAKDNENKKLKRLLSERIAVEGEEGDLQPAIIMPRRKVANPEK
jgi:hypothetical protein